MGFLQWLGGALAFVAGLVVLVKLFQKEGILKGILGLICMLYTYIWGWQHAKEENITNLMWIWTGVIILSVIVAAVFGGSAAGGGGEIPTPTGMLLHIFGI